MELGSAIATEADCSELMLRGNLIDVGRENLGAQRAGGGGAAQPAYPTMNKSSQN